jgi:hypothetical protein
MLHRPTSVPDLQSLFLASNIMLGNTSCWRSHVEIAGSGSAVVRPARANAVSIHLSAIPRVSILSAVLTPSFSRPRIQQHGAAVTVSVPVSILDPLIFFQKATRNVEERTDSETGRLQHTLLSALSLPLLSDPSQAASSPACLVPILERLKSHGSKATSSRRFR